MKNIIITGGSGFIGTNLIIFLLSKNFNILNLDKLSKSANLLLNKRKKKLYFNQNRSIKNKTIKINLYH